jgi:hypothetical protein
MVALTLTFALVCNYRERPAAAPDNDIVGQINRSGLLVVDRANPTTTPLVCAATYLVFG